ncbi:hypothetical protein UC34_00965 [Pandoraea vervacti]|uniref:Uncharacterized protein n=1 Tax=Pandoraea vervacti TaxID=656178 RepID=A0ABN4FMZ6_9BURK|nr:hypothetical protein [Pandoraea vervacti]AJP55946.1 hypothetical protein UC34_00965 [Pandoraea vervacti]
MTTAIEGPTTRLPDAIDEGMPYVTLAQRVREMPSDEASALDIDPLTTPSPPPPSSLFPSPEPDDSGKRGDDEPMEWPEFFNKILTLEWFDGWMERAQEMVDNGE